MLEKIILKIFLVLGQQSLHVTLLYFKYRKMSTV